MVLRICDAGTSSSAPDGAYVANGASGPRAAASSMSRLMMRPRGPDPDRPRRSTPFSSASLRANGDASTRPCPLPFAATGCTEVAATCGGGGGCTRVARGAAGVAATGVAAAGVAATGVAATGAAAGFAAAGAPFCAAATSFITSARSSPASPRIATGSPSLTVSPSLTSSFKQHALVLERELHVRLVGLDLGEEVAGRDLVAFLLGPLRRARPLPSSARASACRGSWPSLLLKVHRALDRGHDARHVGRDHRFEVRRVRHRDRRAGARARPARRARRSSRRCTRSAISAPTPPKPAPPRRRRSGGSCAPTRRSAPRRAAGACAGRRPRPRCPPWPSASAASSAMCHHLRPRRRSCTSLPSRLTSPLPSGIRYSPSGTSPCVAVERLALDEDDRVVVADRAS